MTAVLRDPETRRVALCGPTSLGWSLAGDAPETCVGAARPRLYPTLTARRSIAVRTSERIGKIDRWCEPERLPQQSPSSLRYRWSPAAAPGRRAGARPEPASTKERDIHSFARPDEARVTHVALDLTADFAAQTLSGRATLALQRAARRQPRRPRHPRSRDPERHGARRGAAEVHCSATRTRSSASRSPWSCPADAKEIVVAYRTSPNAAALQWLGPSQTAGRKQPYLYSQGQAILTRTWIPTQDSPGIRQTYSARITVPRELRAVMSAEQLTPGGRRRTRRTDVRVPADAAGSAVSHRARRRRHRVPVARPAHRRLHRAGDARCGRVRVRRPREDGHRRRVAARPVPLGTLRPARPAAVVPVRRHGEPAADVRHADDPRRRSVARLARRARAGAFLVRQPGDQRHVERLLAERRG